MITPMLAQLDLNVRTSLSKQAELPTPARIWGTTVTTYCCYYTEAARDFSCRRPRLPLYRCLFA